MAFDFFCQNSRSFLYLRIMKRWHTLILQLHILIKSLHFCQSNIVITMDKWLDRSISLKKLTNDVDWSLLLLTKCWFRVDKTSDLWIDVCQQNLSTHWPVSITINGCQIVTVKICERRLRNFGSWRVHCKLLLFEWIRNLHIWSYIIYFIPCF